MIRGFARCTSRKRPRRPLLTALGACALVLSCALLVGTAGAMGAARRSGQPTARARDSSSAAGAQAAKPGALAPGSATATLEQCLTATVQAERGATFSGEMTATPASVRMGIQIVLQIRLPGEELFHAVTAPGLGTWRVSDPGVKDYRYLRQVTNLPAPASYRAVVRFRWLNAKNRLIKVAERKTSRCEQPTHEPLTPGGSATLRPRPSGIASVARLDRR